MFWLLLLLLFFFLSSPSPHSGKDHKYRPMGTPSRGICFSPLPNSHHKGCPIHAQALGAWVGTTKAKPHAALAFAVALVFLSVIPAGDLLHPASPPPTLSSSTIPRPDLCSLIS